MVASCQLHQPGPAKPGDVVRVAVPGQRPNESSGSAALGSSVELVLGDLRKTEDATMVKSHRLISRAGGSQYLGCCLQVAMHVKICCGSL